MERPSSQGSDAPAQSGRVGVYDLVRGFSILSMVAFHLCYDLKFIAGWDLAWFAPPLQDVWRASISWTFVFVAGCMSRHSRSNLRRGLEYGAVALVVWAATSVAAVDTPVSFGVIYCMAACTLAAEGLRRLKALPSGYAAAAVAAAAFVLCLGLQDGTVCFGALELPSSWYAGEGLAWLGLPGPAFASGDYYPLLPYLFLYLAGSACADVWRKGGYPAWAKEARVAALNAVGRRTLAVYVAHQPLIMGLLWAAGLIR